MKPLDPTKPVRASDGRPVRIICTDRKGPYPIVALVGDNEDPWSFRADGSGMFWNLVNIPNRISGWINIYGRQRIASGLYLSKEDADRVADATCERDACIYVEVDEGEGLEGGK